MTSYGSHPIVLVFDSLSSEKAYSNDFRYFVPHASMASRIGVRDIPKSLREYSTLGGTSGKTVRIIIPSLSMARRLSVSTF